MSCRSFGPRQGANQGCDHCGAAPSDSGSTVRLPDNINVFCGKCGRSAPSETGVSPAVGSTVDIPNPLAHDSAIRYLSAGIPSPSAPIGTPAAATQCPSGVANPSAASDEISEAKRISICVAACIAACNAPMLTAQRAGIQQERAHDRSTSSWCPARSHGATGAAHMGRLGFAGC